MRRLWVAAGILTVALAGTGCDNDMRRQARYDAYEESAFFKDGRSARPVIEGTVARGQLRDDEHFFEGRSGGEPAETFPVEVTAELLERGRERYNIHCSVCHDRLGYGRGMVVRRGFKRPASFHEPRLREAAPGYFFDVITHGFGAMYDYAAQIAPHDRWAIIAYIRALQYSQNTPLSDLTEAEQKKLDQMKESAGQKAGDDKESHDHAG